MAGLAGVVFAGIVVLMRPYDSSFVVDHAKEALNFNLSVLLYVIVGAVLGAVLTVVTLGLGLLLIIPAALVLAVAWLVFSIQAAIRASEGLPYRYPLSIRFWS